MTKSYAVCTRCTETFLRDSGKSWQKLCWHCWRETKGRNKTYRAPALPDPLRVDFKKYLPLLIRLCHPDRHGNSESANKVTQWLLKARDVKQ
jgi:ribosomal protein L32E